MCGASDSYCGLSEKKKREKARRTRVLEETPSTTGAKKKDRALLLNLVLRDDGEGQASTMNG